MGFCTLLALLLILSTPSMVSAYLDPGTGSFVLQALLVTLLALGASVKMYWRRIKDACSKLFRRQAVRGQDQ